MNPTRTNRATRTPAYYRGRSAAVWHAALGTNRRTALPGCHRSEAAPR